MSVLGKSVALLEPKEEKGLAPAEACVQAVYDNLNNIKHSFFRIGFHLSEAAHMRYYEKLGYANITDFALDKFGFSQSTTYELMGIYQFAHKDNAPLQIAETYEDYSQSQLRELCRLKLDPHGFMRRVKPSDKVENIRKAVTFWNKYVCKHSGAPDVNDITELLELDIDTPTREAQEYLRKKAERSKAENSADAENQCRERNYAGQLPGQIGMVYDDQPEENSAYAEKSDSAPPILIDSELIDYCLTFTADNDFWKERKFRIREFHSKSPSQLEFVNFVKNEYGNGDSSVHGEPFVKMEYGANFTIIRTRGGKVCLSWASVAGNISRLINSGKYFTSIEGGQYAAWQYDRSNRIKKEQEEQEFSAYAENPTNDIEELHRQRTRREYLATLSDEEFATQILLQVARIYPLGKNSADFISTMRKRLKEWLNEPHDEVNE